jgi:hypothetical protein
MSIENLKTEIYFTEFLNVGFNVEEILMESKTITWLKSNFWLNNVCVSTKNNDGIIKFLDTGFDICMTNLKMKMNSK